jgi:hypothetical protein
VEHSRLGEWGGIWWWRVEKYESLNLTTAVHAELPMGPPVMESMTTPVYAGVFSVMRPRPFLRTWLP